MSGTELDSQDKKVSKTRCDSYQHIKLSLVEKPEILLKT